MSTTLNTTTKDLVDVATEAVLLLTDPALDGKTAGEVVVHLANKLASKDRTVGTNIALLYLTAEGARGFLDTDRLRISLALVRRMLGTGVGPWFRGNGPRELAEAVMDRFRENLVRCTDEGVLDMENLHKIHEALFDDIELAVFEGIRQAAGGATKEAEDAGGPV